MVDAFFNCVVPAACHCKGCRPIVLSWPKAAAMASVYALFGLLFIVDGRIGVAPERVQQVIPRLKTGKQGQPVAGFL